MKGLYKKTFAMIMAAMMICTGSTVSVMAEAETKTEMAEEQKESAKFSAQLTDLLAEQSEDNVLVSGLSVKTALAMLAQGATGETLKELEELLGMDQEALRAEAQELLQQYNALEEVTLSMADGLWTNQDLVVKEEYVKLLEEYFEATAREMDFTESESADEINQWISEKTNGLIEDVIDAEMLKGMQAVLANALYFKAGWEDPFVTLEEQDFHNQDGSVTTVEMMSSTEDTYLENEAAFGFMKPYSEGMVFVGILPKEEGEFTLEDLNLDSLVQSQTQDYDVAVSLPKFKIECGTSLNDALGKMGLEKVFTDAAELDGISETELKVSEVIHNTCMEVDENGTEAAASTVVMVKEMALLPEKEIKTVTLDRPFAFGIYDTEHGQWIFTGKMVKMD